MNPLDYAKACAKRYSLARVKIKGRDHVPRVVIDRNNAWMDLLPSEKIVDSRRAGNHFSARKYTSEEIWQSFCLHLLSAGLNPAAQKYHLNELNRHSPVILSRKYWLAAFAYWRLTGQIPDPDPRIAARVAAIPKARETKHRNECAAELAQIRELERRERAALRTATAELTRDEVSRRSQRERQQ